MTVSNTNLQATKLTLVKHQIKRTDFKINPIYSKKIIKHQDDTYTIYLSIEIHNTEENPFPIDLDVEFEATFVFSNDYDTEKIDSFLSVNAIQIVFPFIRSAVNNLVTSALLPPLILPIIDVRFFKESK